MHRNPFQYGRDLSHAELVDRTAELAEIDATIRNRGKLFLIGPRRFGKTSLLSAAAARATAQDVVVLNFDVEKYETLDLLAQGLLTAAARALRSPMERLASLFAESAGRLRPELTLDPATGLPALTLGVRREERGELTMLMDALDAVESLAVSTEREACVMLDEVQALVVAHGETAEKQLRATVQRHRRVAYVFAGSATRLLTAMTSNADRPFYRMGARTFLGPIPRPDFIEFLRAGFVDAGFDAPEAACIRILDLAADVPYNVQRLAYELWEMLRSGDVPDLVPDAVDDALRRIVIREDPAYTQLWTGLTLNQKKALKAVIHEGTALTSAATLARLELAGSSLLRALEALEDRHIVRTEQTEGRASHLLVDPFLGAWLRHAQAP